jgi:preprotein translocase subunit SecG
MVVLITIVHIAVCLFLIIVVLLQSGKSGDIAAAFGGMGSQTAFGPRGAATALSRATTWSAIIFMVTSITLSVFASRHSGTNSVLQGVKASPTKSQRRPLRLPRQFRNNKSRWSAFRSHSMNGKLRRFL